MRDKLSQAVQMVKLPNFHKHIDETELYLCRSVFIFLILVIHIKLLICLVSMLLDFNLHNMNDRNFIIL